MKCLYSALYLIFPGLTGVSFSTTRIHKETDVVYFKILPQTQLCRAVIGRHPNRESNPPTFKYEKLQCPIIKRLDLHLLMYTRNVLAE
jgi:hypothetical protein